MTCVGSLRHEKHNVLKGSSLCSGPMDTSYRIPSTGTCRTDRRHFGQINDEITDLSPEDVGSTETQGTAWLVLQKISF